MISFHRFHRIFAFLLVSSLIIFSHYGPRLCASSSETTAHDAEKADLAAADSFARSFLDGCAVSDWDKVTPVWAGHLDERVQRVLGGLTVISIGKAKRHAFFSSIIVVPCEVKRKGDGQPQKRDLLLKQNKATECWQVNGGI